MKPFITKFLPPPVTVLFSRYISLSTVLKQTHIVHFHEATHTDRTDKLAEIETFNEAVVVCLSVSTQVRHYIQHGRKLLCMQYVTIYVSLLRPIDYDLLIAI